MTAATWSKLNEALYPVIPVLQVGDFAQRPGVYRWHRRREMSLLVLAYITVLEERFKYCNTVCVYQYSSVIHRPCPSRVHKFRLDQIERW